MLEISNLIFTSKAREGEHNFVSSLFDPNQSKRSEVYKQTKMTRYRVPIFADYFLKCRLIDLKSQNEDLTGYNNHIKLH